MGFMSPKPPSVPLPPPSAHPPTLASSTTALAGLNAKIAGQQAEGKGMNNTVKTSPQGLAKPATATATLLGQ